jgi:uncharacterized UPF0160 family protein
MSDTDKDLQELQENIQSSERTESHTEEDTNSSTLADAIVRELDAIDNGQSPNVTIRDRNLAALFRGLEERDELDQLGEAFDEALGNNPAEEYTKADIGRLGVRIGLENAAPETIKALEDALVETIDV